MPTVLVEQLCAIGNETYEPGELVDLDEVMATYQAEHGMVTLDADRIRAAQAYRTRDMMAARPASVGAMVTAPHEPTQLSTPTDQTPEAPKRKRGRPKKGTA